jgi:carboxymethylenebutenolidase
MCHTDDSRAPEPPRKGPVGEHGLLELSGSDGHRFRAYRALPGASARAGMVILPDVRGLHPYYEDLSVRFAEAGFRTIAIDYYGRTAGTGARDDSFDWKANFQRLEPDQVVPDVAAAVARLRAEGDASLPVFTVGFCFGGSQSWRQSGAGHGLSGCIGFYGGHPLQRAGDRIPQMTAPLLMLLGGADEGTPVAEFEEFAGLVRRRGVEVESHTYPGAPHSYFDRSFAEHREACRDSWQRLLAFTDRLTPKR